MRIKFSLFSLFFSCFLNLSGQTRNITDSVNTSSESAKSKGITTIYIYRPYHFNSCAVKFNIQLKDVAGENKIIYKIRNKGVLEVSFNYMQETELGLVGQRKADLERFLVVPGTDYYFKIIFRHLVPILVSVDPITGKAEYTKLKKSARNKVLN